MTPLRTVDDTAAVLNVSRRTVYNLIAAGELEAVRVGRVLRVDDEAIKSYKRRQRVTVAREQDEPEMRMHVPVVSDQRLDPVLANKFR